MPGREEGDWLIDYLPTPFAHSDRVLKQIVLMLTLWIVSFFVAHFVLKACSSTYRDLGKGKGKRFGMRHEQRRFLLYVNSTINAIVVTILCSYV